ncbi:flavodoxin family protein [Nocardioides endophyticus]|uniref:Flavodoxin family protein n=1 Tax=Nocardioides endophyticus TaxID=1353775 RepID=A0ABP8Z1T6_9ACTN
MRSSDNPLRALVVYESMFGCTERAAHAVADGLRAEGLAVAVTDVGRALSAAEAEFDVLVVGAPTHAFSLSRPATRADAVRQGGRPDAATTGLREWLTATPPGEGRGRPAAAFDTRVTKARRLPKAASTRAAHLLAHHRFSLVARPTPFLVQDTDGPLVDGELERAAVWGRAVAVAARRALVPAG